MRVRPAEGATAPETLRHPVPHWLEPLWRVPRPSPHRRPAGHRRGKRVHLAAPANLSGIRDRGGPRSTSLVPGARRRLTHTPHAPEVRLNMNDSQCNGSTPAPDSGANVTPLHQLHVELGGRMVDPLRRVGAPGAVTTERHGRARRRVGTSAALFDVSHMGIIELRARRWLTPAVAGRAAGDPHPGLHRDHRGRIASATALLTNEAGRRDRRLHRDRSGRPPDDRGQRRPGVTVDLAHFRACT